MSTDLDYCTYCTDDAATQLYDGWRFTTNGTQTIYCHPQLKYAEEWRSQSHRMNELGRKSGCSVDEVTAVLSRWLNSHSHFHGDDSIRQPRTLMLFIRDQGRSGNTQLVDELETKWQTFENVPPPVHCAGSVICNVPRDHVPRMDRSQIAGTYRRGKEERRTARHGSRTGAGTTSGY